MFIELIAAVALSQDVVAPTSPPARAGEILNAGDLPWTRMPSLEYPERALARRVHRGQVVLDCAVTPEGGFGACTIKDEDPIGMGFGAAALRGMRSGRLDMTRWSEPRVTFRMSFVGAEL